jgi:sugar phosphate permease
MASAKIKNYRWIIVGLLFTGTVINYLDRQIIGLLKPTLEAEFSWTESDFGKIMSAFSFAYAIGLLVSGRFIDKVGTKMAAKMISPPMVGVPSFSFCPCNPRSLTVSPTCFFLSIEISLSPNIIEMINDVMMAIPARNEMY